MAWHVVVIPTHDDPRDVSTVTGQLYYAVSGSNWINCPTLETAYAKRDAMNALMADEDMSALLTDEEMNVLSANRER